MPGVQVTETQSPDPLALGQQKSAQQTAVVAFAARYHSRMAFQDAQVVLLKEYLPGARSLGCNELQLLHHLYSIPERKWQAASAPLSADPPVVPLLGELLRDCGDRAAAPICSERLWSPCHVRPAVRAPGRSMAASIRLMSLQGTSWQAKVRQVPASATPKAQMRARCGWCSSGRPCSPSASTPLPNSLAAACSATITGQLSGRAAPWSGGI